MARQERERRRERFLDNRSSCTRAREHESTRAREHESTRAREHESTRAREHESTRDYYTQDRQGNVWYFGEDTGNLDKNLTVTTTAGTFHAGEAGALPGIFMLPNPQVGFSHRQEYYKGHAEDFFQILDLSVSVKVP